MNQLISVPASVSEASRYITVFIFTIISYFRLDVQQLHSNRTKATLPASFEFLLSVVVNTHSCALFDQEKTASYVVTILYINCSDIISGAGCFVGKMGHTFLQRKHGCGRSQCYNSERLSLERCTEDFAQRTPPSSPAPQL